MANLSVHEAVDDSDEYSLQTHTIRSTSCYRLGISAKQRYKKSHQNDILSITQTII